MIAWSMAQLLLLGALLALAAYGAESALTVAGRQTRWVWLSALLMTVVLGALAPMRLMQGGRAIELTLSAAPATAIAAPAAPAGALELLQRTWSAARSRGEALVQQAWSAWHDVMPAQVETALLLAWLVASLALLLLFVGVHVRYHRRRAQWPQRLVRGTTVRVADDTGPAVIGVTRTEIVVPSWLLARESREQELVLAHELEHVRLHDPLLLAVAQAAVVLLPWHPAVWWMASRMRLAVELDCDRRVLQRGASARDYGTLLIDLTDHRAGFGAALPAFSCSPSHLERRLVAMTPKRLKYPLVRALTAGAFASLALLAACEAKLPTSEEVNAMTARSATEAAAFATMVDTAAVRYFIDDVPATKAQAEKLSAEQIATVNVLQKGTQSGGEVRIMTRTPTPADSTDPTRIMLRRADPTQVTFHTPGDTVTASAGSTTIARTQLDAKRADESKPRTPFTGLLVVDGVARESNAMNTISPDQIISVNVMKGAAATAKYSDPRAANGVIEIVTKKATP
ncbi:MAG: hypothetical protein IT355_16260 [Gemmatimonadaceae bacterium]|nr:hypothetical protein [Gemmatimonadaceae bacterium]